MVGSEEGSLKLPLPKDWRSSTRRSRQGCTTRRETLESHRIWHRAGAWIIASDFARMTKVECKYWKISAPAPHYWRLYITFSPHTTPNFTTRDSHESLPPDSGKTENLLQPHRRTCWGNCKNTITGALREDLQCWTADKTSDQNRNYSAFDQIQRRLRWAEIRRGEVRWGRIWSRVREIGAGISDCEGRRSWRIDGEGVEVYEGGGVGPDVNPQEGHRGREGSKWRPLIGCQLCLARMPPAMVLPSLESDASPPQYLIIFIGDPFGGF